MRKYIYLLIIALLTYCGIRSATRDDGQEVYYAQAVSIVDQQLEDSSADWGYDGIKAFLTQLYEPSTLRAEGVMSQLMREIPKIKIIGYFVSNINIKKALSIFNFLTIRIRGSDISYLSRTAYKLPGWNPKQNSVRGREPTYSYERGIRYG